MSDKEGRSEEKTDFFGNKYTQHYDSDGNKSGWSEEKTDFFGDKYTQRYDQDYNKTGWSEEKADFSGDKYTQHHNEDYNKTGWSEEKTDFFGDGYTQHYDQDYNKTGWSEGKTSFFGDKYTQHYGSAGSHVPPSGDGVDSSPSDGSSSGSPHSTAYYSAGASHAASSSYSTSSGRGVGAIVGVICLVLLGGVALLLIGGIAFFNYLNPRGGPESARQSPTAKVGTVREVITQLNVRSGPGTEYPVVTVFPKCSRIVEIKGEPYQRAADGGTWMRVASPDGQQEGWANQKFVNMSSSSNCESATASTAAADQSTASRSALTPQLALQLISTNLSDTYVGNSIYFSADGLLQNDLSEDFAKYMVRQGLISCANGSGGGLNIDKCRLTEQGRRSPFFGSATTEGRVMHYLRWADDGDPKLLVSAIKTPSDVPFKFTRVCNRLGSGFFGDAPEAIEASAQFEYQNGRWVLLGIDGMPGD